MITILVVRVHPILRIVPPLAIAAIAPLLLALARGWLYAHPLRLRTTNGESSLLQGIDYEEVILQSADGYLLSAWYTPPQDGALILVGHGYANVRPAGIHALFAKHGYGVISWDFRAHGKSQGRLCTIGHDEALDVEAALDYALSQPGVTWIGMWGGSMGGAAAFHAATRRPEIRAIIADSVPYSAIAVLHKTVKFPLFRRLIQGVSEREMQLDVDDVRPDVWISQMSPRPVLLIQGTDDKLIPADSARRLQQAAGGRAQVWYETGAAHLTIFEDRPDEYERRVILFLDEARKAN